MAEHAEAPRKGVKRQEQERGGIGDEAGALRVDAERGKLAGALPCLGGSRKRRISDRSPSDALHQLVSTAGLNPDL